jgi:hypothetical protein
MVAWSEMTLSKGTRVASFDLPPTDLHTFDIQIITGKKTVYTRNLPLVSPAVGAPMGGLRNTDLAFQMVAVAKVGGGWATSGRTGLWVSEPWLSIWKLFAGNCGDKFSDYRSLQSFSFGMS